MVQKTSPVVRRQPLSLIPTIVIGLYTSPHEYWQMAGWIYGWVDCCTCKQSSNFDSQVNVATESKITLLVAPLFSHFLKCSSPFYCPNLTHPSNATSSLILPSWRNKYFLTVLSLKKKKSYLRVLMLTYSTNTY